MFNVGYKIKIAITKSNFNDEHKKRVEKLTGYWYTDVQVLVPVDQGGKLSLQYLG